jgi:4-hydroxy-3-polyprenylbenzoate decarboxylase
VRKIVIAITGASGSIYAKACLDRMAQLQKVHPGSLEVGVVMSKNARDVWEYELGNTAYNDYPFKIYAKDDFFAPFASGSAGYDTLIAVPCSMGTLGRMAAGLSDDLITRTADVMLKERRKLILALRETPYHLIHLRNMTALTEAGAIIAPCTPSFYSRPSNLEDLARTVSDRLLDLAGLASGGYKWGETT